LGSPRSYPPARNQAVPHEGFLSLSRPGTLSKISVGVRATDEATYSWRHGIQVVPAEEAVF
jgi:hypothetical protein